MPPKKPLVADDPQTGQEEVKSPLIPDAGQQQKKASWTDYVNPLNVFKDKPAPSTSSPTVGDTPHASEGGQKDATQEVKFSGDEGEIGNRHQSIQTSADALPAIYPRVEVGATAPQKEMLGERKDLYSVGGVGPIAEKQEAFGNLQGLSIAKGSADEKLFNEQSKAYADAQELLGARNAESSARHQREISELADREQGLKNYADSELDKKLDTGKFFSNPLGILASAMSVFAGGLLGKDASGGVVAAIKQDLENQKENMARARTLYDAKKNSLSTFRDIVGDNNMADALWEAKAKQNVALKIEELSSKMQSKDAANHGLAVAQRLRIEAADDIQKINLITTKQPMAVPKGTAGYYDRSFELRPGKANPFGPPSDAQLAAQSQQSAPSGQAMVNGQPKPSYSQQAKEAIPDPYSQPATAGQSQPAATGPVAPLPAVKPKVPLATMAQNIIAKKNGTATADKPGAAFGPPKPPPSEDDNVVTNLPNGVRQQYARFANKNDTASSVIKEGLLYNYNKARAGAPMKRNPDGTIVFANPQDAHKFNERMAQYEKDDAQKMKDIPATIATTAGVKPGNIEGLSTLQTKLAALNSMYHGMTHEKWNELINTKSSWLQKMHPDVAQFMIDRGYDPSDGSNISKIITDVATDYDLIVNRKIKDEGGTAINAGEMVRQNMTTPFNPRNYNQMMAGINGMSRNAANATQSVLNSIPEPGVKAMFLLNHPVYQKFLGSGVAYQGSSGTLKK